MSGKKSICERCGELCNRRTKCPGCGKMLDAWCYAEHAARRADCWPCQWDPTTPETYLGKHLAKK